MGVAEWDRNDRGNNFHNKGKASEKCVIWPACDKVVGCSGGKGAILVREVHIIV